MFQFYLQPLGDTILKTLPIHRQNVLQRQYSSIYFVKTNLKEI